MRSPNWHECETKLALDLYLSKDIKWLLRMTDSTFEIVTFSKILNELDFYEEKPEKFRSTGSIRMKLANFMSLDKRYNKNSLGNVGKSDKLIWEKYHDNPNTLHDECREIINEHLKRRDPDIDRYLENMELDYNELFHPNFVHFTKSLNRAIIYYEKIAKKNSDVKYAKEVIEWCQKTKKSLKWIDGIDTNVIEFDLGEIYREHAGINLVPIKNLKKKKANSNEIDGEEKIGKLVQRTFSELVEQDRITDEIISNLLDAKYSKITFGLKPPFLICVKRDQPIKEQVIDENGYARYWTKPITIHGKDYCVSKEWYPNQRERYLRWLNGVNVKPFL